MTDLDARGARIDAFLDGTGHDALWFLAPPGFAWLTGGDNTVGGDAVAAAGYVPDAPEPFRAVALAGEAARVADEELPDRFAVETVPWYEPLGESLATRVSGTAAVAAGPGVDAPELAHVDAGPLRRPLADGDVERARSLGEETAAAVERVCRELSPGDTEHEVASALRITLSSGRVSAPVVRVTGSERAGPYRTPPAGAAELGDFAVVHVTTERDGLHASLSRTVAFDAPDSLEPAFRAAARVEATALAATADAAGAEGTAGTAGAVFERVREAYGEVGHPDAWEAGEQGGAVGFDRREWLAAPGAEHPVTAPMTYAWSPVVDAGRSEDTYLVCGDGTVECLTATPNWPTFDAEAVGAERTFERHAPLSL